MPLAHAVPQLAPTTGLLSVHWLEAVGIVAAIALAKVYDARFAHPRIKKERNDELDSRLNSVRTAIDISSQAIRHDVTTLSGEVRDLKAHVIGPDGKNGLRGEVRIVQRELAALAPRRRRR